MWEILSAFPILFIAGFLQIGFFGQIHLLHGSADLILMIVIGWSLNSLSRYSWIWVLLAGLIMSFLSAMPMNGYMFIYIFVWLIIMLLRKHLWQMPMILMLFMTIVGTIIESGFAIGMLTLTGGAINYTDAFEQILIPSLVLNLLLAIPTYAFLNDVANTIYYDEIEE